MISPQQLSEARLAAAALLRHANLGVTDAEMERIEVADFGLSDLRREGAQILTWVGTDRIGVKLIALQAWQALPEHWHPPVGGDPGKEETIRVVWGRLLVGTDGPDTMKEARLPEGKAECYTRRNEHALGPGDQMMFTPGAPHWFQGGPEGTVLFSFSTVARDVLDQFTDPDVERVTVVGEPGRPE